MYQVDGDMYKVCPYDRNHVVSKPRFQLHVIKCKEKHPKNLSTCFYNYSHKVKREHLLEHYEMCPNKSIADEDRHFELMTYLRDANRGSYADEFVRNAETLQSDYYQIARERETKVGVCSSVSHADRDTFLMSAEIDEFGFVVDDRISH